MSPFRSSFRTGPRPLLTGTAVLTTLMLPALGFVSGCGGSASDATAATGAGTDAPGGNADVSRAPAAPQAAGTVKAFYDRYLEDPVSKENQHYLTPELAARIYAGKGHPDLVFCDTSAPDSATYSEPSLSGDALRVTVTTRRKGSAHRTIDVTVTIPDILVSGISCPAS